jgi:protein-S-isoprenylcysteine O-methyltransferase Ste14
VFVALFGLGVAALVVAIWRIGGLVNTKVGRIGWRICVAGVVFLGLFAVQALVTVALTGDIPGNFVLFALGFVLLFVGHLLIALGLRDALGRAWVLPLVGAAGILVAITVEDGVHDIGLFVFEGAWIALGVALLRAEHRPGPETASALV